MKRLLTVVLTFCVLFLSACGSDTVTDDTKNTSIKLCFGTAVTLFLEDGGSVYSASTEDSINEGFVNEISEDIFGINEAVNLFVTEALENGSASEDTPITITVVEMLDTQFKRDELYLLLCEAVENAVLNNALSGEYKVITSDENPDSLVLCSVCGGNGKAECSVCECAGITECTDCGGTGIHHCTVCDDTYAVVCEKCGGAGVDGEGLTCESCKGEGSLSCHACLGKRGIRCENCDGAGYASCSACEGAGIVTCENCAGRGYAYK